MLLQTVAVAVLKGERDPEGDGDWEREPVGDPESDSVPVGAGLLAVVTVGH